MLWTCFDDETEQCGTCIKCVRTQLNILCAGENPADWGFKKFDEKRFSRHVRIYQYCERNLCWLWDIVDSIDDTVTYPYCDKLLHWLKGVGYKRYSQRAKRAFYVKMLLRIHRKSRSERVVEGACGSDHGRNERDRFPYGESVFTEWCGGRDNGS